ncbi:NfeD family protein [Deinococcus sp. AJ005]|uniref:NfeD family protein n=1 Tax=Deinococcus sp. AJ005 TaxID=2652443 RepID=UPI00125CBC04|nr:hypothetical protein [Deinococcus sp. AJ005]QFP77607.1 YqiJ family protein [Deinococcus sp. AJ005]
MGIYLICLIVGGVLFGLSLLGGHDVGGHDLAADHPGSGDIASWFSLRALVSFATFFGLAGVMGGLIGASVTVQFVMALVSGLAVGGFTAYLFRLARTRGEVSGGTGRLAGRTGEVLISPAPGRPGRVAVTISGQVTQLAAHSDDALHPGDAVIVIGQQGGVLDVKLWDGA